MKLLICPFCKSDVVKLSQKVIEQHYYILCRKCGATGPLAQTREEASKKWNTRPMVVWRIRQKMDCRRVK